MFIRVGHSRSKTSSRSVRASKVKEIMEYSAFCHLACPRGSWFGKLVLLRLYFP